jgi:hypothetical protein
MTTKDERLSLMKEPLPPEEVTKQPGDELLPSRILEYDREIVLLEAQLISMRQARQNALDKAIALNIGKDEGAIIIFKETLSDREIDAVRLKAEKPEIFDKAMTTEIAAEHERIQKRIDALYAAVNKEPVKIRIKTLQGLLGDDDITTLSLPRKISRTYQVVRADLPIPTGKGIKLLTEG